jgi:proline iminopeptidase
VTTGTKTTVFALLGLACAHSQERLAPVPSPEGDVPGAGGVRLHYRITGHGPDTVVVLHGGPGLNMEGLRPDLEPLERDHALLYYDQRGSGRSELPDSLALTADAMVEDLEAVRQRFRIEQLTLLGHSWGGGLALLYTMRYPRRVRRMVLVGSLGLRGKPYLPEWFGTQAARRDSVANARLLVLDSLMAIAPGSPEICREWFRLRRPGILASPRNAAKIKGDYCAGDPTYLSRSALVARRVLSSFMPKFLDLEYDWRSQAAALSTRLLQSTELRTRFQSPPRRNAWGCSGTRA